MTIQASYDRNSDVLYVALGSPRKAYVDERPEGLLFRYALDDDAPCGVTIIGFSARWLVRSQELAEAIGRFLGAPADEVVRALPDTSRRQIAG